jgi:heme/copper-type cytochrome/quinol oxidase subunit 2
VLTRDVVSRATESKPDCISVSSLKGPVCNHNATQLDRAVGQMANDALVLLFMILIVLVVMVVSLVGGFYLVKYLVEYTFNS